MLRSSLLLLAMTLVANAQWRLMPLPASIQQREGSLKIAGLVVRVVGVKDPRLDSAVARFRSRLSSSPAGESGNSAAPQLTVRTMNAAAPVQQLGEDESYRLEVDPQQASLTATNALGAMRGLETLLQLTEKGSVPAVVIEDHPRFPWRGLHLDVSRHFMPLEVVERTLDGMAAVKLNVFHWHLSDDQGFRVESKRYPKLQEKGSDGLFYTQDQIREVIAYARDRGIRVVPEFDIPGHATSWLTGYPELSAGPGPFEIIRTWGIFDPTLDPSNPKVYEFLDGFIGEMAALFPDAYFHIGGDEVNGKQWKGKGLTNTAAVHAEFNQKVQKIVARYGKRMEGWDEILNDSLPRDIVIQSWRGQRSLFEAAGNGFSGILSAGYYLDHMETAAKMYSVDPLDPNGRATGMLRNPDGKSSAPINLPEAQKQKILGGEVCMWTEYVSPETVDSRIWPRAAAVAERFWSPATTTDVFDLYRRLDWISAYLDRFGLKHNSNYTMMLSRLGGGPDIEPLKTLADVVTPGDLGLRHRMKRDYTQQTALDRFVDAARPDSPVIHHFETLTASYLASRNDPALRSQVRMFLQKWAGNDNQLRPLLARRPQLAEVAPLSTRLAQIAQAALDSMDGKTSGPKPIADWKQPVAEVRLTIADSIEKIITAGR